MISCKQKSGTKFIPLPGPQGPQKIISCQPLALPPLLQSFLLEQENMHVYNERLLCRETYHETLSSPTKLGSSSSASFASIPHLLVESCEKIKKAMLQHSIVAQLSKKVKYRLQ